MCIVCVNSGGPFEVISGECFTVTNFGLADGDYVLYSVSSGEKFTRDPAQIPHADGYMALIWSILNRNLVRPGVWCVCVFTVHSPRIITRKMHVHMVRN